MNARPGHGFIGEEELAQMGFASVGTDVQIDASARFYGASRIELGSHVRIDAYAVLSAGEGGIRIGNYVHISVFALLVGAASIELADFSNVAGRASIYSSSDTFDGRHLLGPTVPMELRNVKSAPVTLARHAAVCAAAVVMPGVTIGEGALVGALTFVRHDVAPYTCVYGPSQKVKKRKLDTPELERRLRELTGE